MRSEDTRTKNLLKRFFVPALASRPISALATRVFGRGIPIFMVHRMVVPGQPTTGITPDHLRRCLHYLQEARYSFVSLEELILALRNQTPLPDRAVVFTMDDGFRDQAQIAAPIFLEFGCPITFFVITGLIDQQLWPWDAQVSWVIDNSPQSLLRADIEDESFQVKLGDPRQRRLARQRVRDILKEMDAELVPNILDRLARAAGAQLEGELIGVPSDSRVAAPCRRCTLMSHWRARGMRSIMSHPLSPATCRGSFVAQDSSGGA